MVEPTKDYEQSTGITFDPAWLLVPGEFKSHHPVFQAFEPSSDSGSADYSVDYIGSRTRNIFARRRFGDTQVLPVDPLMPTLDQQYFEWIDLLLSVLDAKQHYEIIELGAGWGAWAVRAVLAARQRNIESIHAGLVEAEPAHLMLLNQHLSDNAISQDEAAVYPVAVSDEDGTTQFYVGRPNDFDDEIARRWYGQAIVKDYEHPKDTGQNPPAAMYYGHPVTELESGWKTVSVQKVDIRNILPDFQLIDLIDFDVQGEELKIVRAAVKPLDEKVKRLHIGTHSHELEDGLRAILIEHEWICVRDFGCEQVNETPFGKISFVDGIQSWINPRFDVTIA